jgi:O-methyltransferase
LYPSSEVNIVATLLELTVLKNIKGNAIELGVYKGGTLVELAKRLKARNSNKIIYGLDTFSGHPYTDSKAHYKGRYKDVDYSTLKDIISSLKLDNIRLVAGLFKDSFISLNNERFCFAHVDCDLYESTKEALEFLLPRMSYNAIIYFDDYNSQATGEFVQKAISEFIDKEDIIMLSNNRAYFIVK